LVESKAGPKYLVLWKITFREKSKLTSMLLITGNLPKSTVVSMTCMPETAFDVWSTCLKWGETRSIGREVYEYMILQQINLFVYR